jgi:hypothetical protein
MNTTELTEIQIDNLCSKIEQEKLLPLLPYIYTELSSKEFETDTHLPFYYNSNVNIGDDMSGFLYVNMDGFFSDCVNEDEVTQIFNWDSIEEIKIKIGGDRKSCIIALCAEGGMLTIEEPNGSSLKIVKAIYDYVWKDVIIEFKDSPILMWSKIEDMGVKRKVFNTFSELSKYSEEKVKPLKVKKHEQPSDFLSDYPGELYCENVRWDEKGGFGETHPLKIQPFPNVFEDGEFKYEDLFRRFTHDEVNMIVGKIKSTGTLIYLPFVYKILNKKFDLKSIKAPFWFDPFIISAALNGAAGIFYFEHNGFYSNTYDSSGNWLEPTRLNRISLAEDIYELSQEPGYNNYWPKSLSNKDEDIVTTMDITLKDAATGATGQLSLIQTNGSKYASTLPIIEAIWNYSLREVVKESIESGTFSIPENSKSFESWDALLKWAKSENITPKSKGIIEVHPLQKSNAFIHVSYIFFKIKHTNEEGLTLSGFNEAKALSLQWIANDKPSMEGIDDLFDNIHKIIEEDADNKLFSNSLKYIASSHIYYKGIFSDLINLIDRSKNLKDVIILLDMVCEVLKPKNASLLAELISTTKLEESKNQKPCSPNDNIENIGSKTTEIISKAPVNPDVSNEKNHKVDSNSPIWKIIQYEFNNLNVESIQRKEFSELILKKHPHIKKGTLAAQISIQVVNKRARTGYAQCNKVRLCGDDKFDFLFENEDKSICRYQQHIHKSYEIYQRDDGKLDVRKLEEIKVENEEFWWEMLDDFKVENKIVIVNIDRKDLEQNNVDSLKQIGIVENGDWETFSKLTSKNEADLNKKDFGDKDLEFLVLLYCNGVYVTSINSFNSPEEDRLQKLKLSDASIVLWEVTFEIAKDYDKKKYTFNEAQEHFCTISDGGGQDEFEEDLDDSDESWYFSDEFSYYCCDSGHGGNIINDCLIAISEDGINMDEFDWQYRWRKIDSSDQGYHDYLKMGLATYSKNIKLQGDVIIGENLSEFIDN